MSFSLWKKAAKIFASSTPPANGSVTVSGGMPPNYSAEADVKQAILGDRPPPGLWTYKLRFEDELSLESLPRGLQVSLLSVKNCPQLKSLPDDLWATSVIISNCPAFGQIPSTASIEHLHVEDCGDIRFAEGCALGDVKIRNCRGVRFADLVRFSSLELRESSLEKITSRIAVTDELDFSGSRSLVGLPEGLKTRRVILRNCSSLSQLPDRLETLLLDVSGCVQLQWQEDALVEAFHMNVADCPQIATLPCWLISLQSLDVANSGLTGLPEGFSHCDLFWHGVRIDERIAFHPEQIQASEILSERNAEIRRVMLERVGWERFIREAQPTVLNRDTDPGGERKLLGFYEPASEPLVVLSVICPSTGRNYFLRVPPNTRTCHQAAAWIAGFNVPDQYNPVKET